MDTDREFVLNIVCAYLSGGFIDKHLKLKKKEKSSIRSVSLFLFGFGSFWLQLNFDLESGAFLM